MSESISFDAVYTPSEDIVARDIEGELIIVPLTAGFGDMEDTLFTLNPTGRAIWDRLDGRRTLRETAAELAALYRAPIRCDRARCRRAGGRVGQPQDAG